MSGHILQFTDYKATEASEYDFGEPPETSPSELRSQIIDVLEENDVNPCPTASEIVLTSVANDRVVASVAVVDSQDDLDKQLAHLFETGGVFGDEVRFATTRTDTIETLKRLFGKEPEEETATSERGAGGMLRRTGRAFGKTARDVIVSVTASQISEEISRRRREQPRTDGTTNNTNVANGGQHTNSEQTSSTSTTAPSSNKKSS